MKEDEVTISYFILIPVLGELELQLLSLWEDTQIHKTTAAFRP